MAQTQYLSNGGATQTAAATARPVSLAQLACYVIFAASVGFTVALVVGLIG